MDEDDTDDDTDDDYTDDDNDHKNDGYTAAGAAPNASVPCYLLLAPRSLFLVLVLDSGFWLPVSGFRLLNPLISCKLQISRM